jgi:hypothetical protein
MPLDEFHSVALAARPDLKAAVETVDKAETDHKLAVSNGSTDPTFGMDLGRNPPITIYIGFSVNIPLRIFDKNQGEKLRTEIDITHAQRQKDAAEAQVFSDVDSAYFTVVSSVNLLLPYKGTDGYLETATRIRDAMSFAYSTARRPCWIIWMRSATTGPHRWPTSTWWGRTLQRRPAAASQPVELRPWAAKSHTLATPSPARRPRTLRTGP